MILSALVFGRQLRRAEVPCRGITDVQAEVDEAAARGARLRHVATIDDSGVARVGPEALSADDPLARVEGRPTRRVRASPLARSRSPAGAGPQLAGQGVLSDLIAVITRPPRPRSTG